MTRYILQRLALLPLLMVVYSFVIFAIMQAPPGDFLTAYVATLASSGSSLSAEQIAAHARAVRARSAVLRPVPAVAAAPAARRFRPVARVPAAERRPDRRACSGLTLALALFSFVLTWVLAIPAGIYSATHPRSIGDHVLTVINYVGVATPNFMLALVLMWVAFAYFDISVTGLFSPEYVEAPWSFAKFVDLLAISGCRRWCWASPAPRG